MPGKPPRALLLVAVAQEIGQADVVVQRDSEATARDARVRHLLHDDLVEAEVRDPRAAERLGDRHREHPPLRRLGEQLPRDDALPLPLGVVWDDLRGEEAA